MTVRARDLSRQPRTVGQRIYRRSRNRTPDGSRPMSRRFTLLCGTALAVAAPPLSAQTSLGRPTARLAEDFGSIQTVRELPGGRVLVADPLGKALYLVDFSAGTRTQVGSEGQGPQEYRQPDAGLAAPGRLHPPGGSRQRPPCRARPRPGFGPTRPIAQGDFQPGQPLVLAIPQGVDGSGCGVLPIDGRRTRWWRPPGLGRHRPAARVRGARRAGGSLQGAGPQGLPIRRCGEPERRASSRSPCPRRTRGAWRRTARSWWRGPATTTSNGSRRTAR